MPRFNYDLEFGLTYQGGLAVKVISNRTGELAFGYDLSLGPSLDLAYRILMANGMVAITTTELKDLQNGKKPRKHISVENATVSCV